MSKIRSMIFSEKLALRTTSVFIRYDEQLRILVGTGIFILMFVLLQTNNNNTNCLERYLYSIFLSCIGSSQ